MESASPRIYMTNIASSIIILSLVAIAIVFALPGLLEQVTPVADGGMLDTNHAWVAGILAYWPGLVIVLAFFAVLALIIRNWKGD